jgi:pimeloyl-ACP methyl ester carboxylesterase
MNRSIGNGGVTLQCEVTGSGSGPAVVLLHGFPENHASWRHQVPALAAAGLTVLAPDLRGYGESDAPHEVAAYAPDVLISDVAAIVRASGRPRAHIVGHDWGGMLAWWFAAAHPELTDRLVIMNSPHPGIFRRRVRRPPQLLRSWYAAFFQLPALPELSLRAFDFAALRRLFRTTTAQRGVFSEAQIDAYAAALARPGRLRGALNYYRAVVRHGARAPRPVRTDAQTLIIWGEQDVALTIGLLDGVERYAPNVRVERLPGAGHWVQNEAPDQVNALLTEFLAG